MSVFALLYYEIKFRLVPSERNFFLYIWCQHRRFRIYKTALTVNSYLDELLASLELEESKSETSWERRRLYRRFRHCVYDPVLYAKIAALLKTIPFSEELCAALVDAMKRVGRPGLGVGADIAQVLSRSAEPTLIEAVPDTPLFHARTYIIASHIWFELEGKEAEFESLSRRIPELAAFVKERFAVKHLPGTFEAQKGYSYKNTLKDKNASKRGQLKPCFRQIIDNPQVFGGGVAEKAEAIFKEYFT